jgi:hypothetical protein
LPGGIVRLAGLGFVQIGLFELYYVVAKTAGIRRSRTLWLDIRGYVLYTVLQQD